MKIEPGWWRMRPEYILEYFRLWNDPETLHFDLKPQFFSLNPNFRKCHVLLCPPNSLFSLQISQSTLYKMFLRTIQTILVFIIVWFWLDCFHQNIIFWEQNTLWNFCRKDDFIGRHVLLFFWRYVIYIYTLMNVCSHTRPDMWAYIHASMHAYRHAVHAYVHE